MTKHNLDNLSGSNEIGERKITRERFTDIHCHCLCDIDDGPETLSDSLDLCKALVDDGITSVIATPHQLGRYGEFNDADKISIHLFTRSIYKNHI